MAHVVWFSTDETQDSWNDFLFVLAMRESTASAAMILPHLSRYCPVSASTGHLVTIRNYCFNSHGHNHRRCCIMLYILAFTRLIATSLSKSIYLVFLINRCLIRNWSKLIYHVLCKTKTTTNQITVVPRLTCICNRKLHPNFLDPEY